LILHLSMKKKHIAIIAIFFCGILFSFFAPPPDSPKDDIKKKFVDNFEILVKSIHQLRVVVENDETGKNIQASFLAARLAYKQIEFILEYYYELDVSKINGPGIDFVEEEDPLAYHEPQGFQMIESFLYPAYDVSRKKELLQFIIKLYNLTNGLSKNAGTFQPGEYVLDAAMEELYRILALGITGFDSPTGHLSLYEAKSSLNSVMYVIASYKNEIFSSGINDYDRVLYLLQKATLYLDKNSDFEKFNRMEFIIKFLNPLASWLGNAKQKMGYIDSPIRYGLIKKTTHLFAWQSLQRDRYLFDDTITNARIALGKKLFYEPGLSKNGKRSCAGCHQPARAFTDGLPKANELDEHTSLLRNTPTLWNAALQSNLFYDSRQVSLDHLITEVLANEKEMNSGRDTAAVNLKNRADYKQLYAEAYPAAGGIIQGRKIVNAIAMYLRTIVSYNSRFDQFMRGKKSAMKPNEIKGFNLFMGKALCGTCHYVPLFNGSKPPSYYYQESEVIGVPASTDTNHAVLDSDPGRYAIIKKEFLLHSFKTPTLRNIALTAPYMHNGVYKTLEEVIEFYNKGGAKGLHIDIDNQTLPFDNLGLNATEQKDIIAFLKTLTDTTELAISHQLSAISYRPTALGDKKN
ncbi:MAG: cytochrome c peroxidase, partial [Chitinophagaceae bacterium]